MAMTSTLTESPTRVKILASARALIERQGFSAVGLEQVAARAGVSRQAVYLHFGSRVGLLLELVEQVDQEEGLEELRRAVWSAESAQEALDAYLHLFLTLTPRVLGVALALEAARRSDPLAGRVWSDRAKRRWTTCNRVAGHLAGEGSLCGITRREAADLLWTLTSARSYEELVVEQQWSKRKMIRVIKKALINDE